jgi:hypothetical protein
LLLAALKQLSNLGMLKQTAARAIDGKGDFNRLSYHVITARFDLGLVST